MPPPRSARLLNAAAHQLPALIIATLLVGFGYLTALLVSGRTVSTWDVAAAATAAATTAGTGLWLLAAMIRAGEHAIAAARKQPARPPAGVTGTRQMPTVTPTPGGDPAGDYDIRAAQARVNDAYTAGRHHFRDDTRYGHGRA